MISAAQIEQRRSNVTVIAASRRAATHCKRGHEFTAANTYTRPSDGHRQCLTCTTDRGYYRNRGLGMVA